MRQRGYSAELERAAGSLAFRDDLTGLLNRRFLSHLFDEWWANMVAEHERVSVMMLDLDGFKMVNDTFGHQVGDRILRATASVLRDAFRGDDVIVRYGGDEFVVVLPGASPADAVRLGERAREAMERLRSGRDALPQRITGPVSFSIGVASYPEDAPTAEEVLAVADTRLFEDKRERRPVDLGRRALRWGWIGVALAAVAVATVAGVVGLRSRGQRGGEPGAALAVPTVPAFRAAPTSSLREAELLGEIDRLRGELAGRRAGEGTPAAGNDEGREVDRLLARIAALEEELRRPAGEFPAEPVAVVAPPTSAPSPTRAPPPAATPAPVTATAPTATSPGPPVVVPPVLQRYDRPRYPEMAVRLRREAAVELRVWVDADGRVARVEPVGAPVGLGFDDAAREAAFSAVYTPGTRNGRPTAMETILTIRFRLAEAP